MPAIGQWRTLVPVVVFSLLAGACGGTDEPPTDQPGAPSPGDGPAAPDAANPDAANPDGGSPDTARTDAAGPDASTDPDGSYAVWRLTERGAVVEIEAPAYRLTLDTRGGLVLRVGPPGRRRPVGAYVVHDGRRVPVAEAERPVAGVDHLRVDVTFAEPGSPAIRGAVEVAADGAEVVALRLSLDDPAGVEGWGWEVDPPSHSFEVEVPPGATVVDHRLDLGAAPSPG